MNDLRFPMFISLENKKVVIFGGGKVAYRRANTLLLFHADITVIAPKLCEEMDSLSSKVKCVFEAYQECYLTPDTFIVIAATNEEKTNEEIYKQCKKRNILVNNASKQEQCDFFFPAVVMEEDIVVGIAGNGSNHKKVSAFAKKLREEVSNRGEIDEKN
jgi:siroheme synthase-like protein